MVAAGDARAADPQLPRHPHWDELAAVIQDVQAIVRQRHADWHRVPHFADEMSARPHRRFGGAVHVVDPPGPPGIQGGGQLRGERLAADQECVEAFEGRGRRWIRDQRPGQ